MKKTLKLVVILVLLLILLRGVIYRSLISYNEMGSRQEIKITDKSLIEKIELESANCTIDIHNIARIANKITITELTFTTKQCSNDPNRLIHSKKANYVGYSAMFNSIVNYLIRQNGLESQIQAKHNIGQLNIIGMDLHQFFKSSFFKDHDYNEIRSSVTTEVLLVDPSLSDYLGIKRVSLK